MSDTQQQTNMDAVVERLRASKQRFEDEQYQKGHEAGREWAENSAEHEELIKLSEWKADAGRDWEVCFADDHSSAYGASEVFVFYMRPEDDGDRKTASEFWEESGFGKHPKGEFVRGFTEGALSVWDEVKDQI